MGAAVKELTANCWALPQVLPRVYQAKDQQLNPSTIINPQQGARENSPSQQRFFTRIETSLFSTVKHSTDRNIRQRQKKKTRPCMPSPSHQRLFIRAKAYFSNGQIFNASKQHSTVKKKTRPCMPSMSQRLLIRTRACFSNGQIFMFNGSKHHKCLNKKTKACMHAHLWSIPPPIP